MPLDGHSYLVAQGWGGSGKALREGALSRPVTVSQKKTLSGIGKDRDEAFPFWDHIFSVAANAIKVTVQGEDDDDTDTPQPSRSNTPLDRTTTGIISNRPRKTGTPALSGSATPNTAGAGLSIMTIAKREAAKRQLYAHFFRGPVLGASEKDIVVCEDRTLTGSIVPPTESPQQSSTQITRDEKKRKKKSSSDKSAKEQKDQRAARKEMKKQQKAKESETAKDQEKTKEHKEKIVKETGGSECDIVTAKRNQESYLDVEERPERVKKKKKRKRSEI